MSRVLDRVSKLLALATSPNEEEARTAAIMACRMIAKHKLVISEERPTLRVEREPWKDPSRYRQWDMWSEVLRRTAAKATPQPFPDKWMSVRASKLETCGGCEGQIHPNDYMWIREGRRPQHFECFDPNWEVAE